MKIKEIMSRDVISVKEDTPISEIAQIMSKEKILVVEDEPDVLKVIKLRITNAGYTVITATNGQEGLDCVAKECPDLIVSDVLMPVMDGFAFYIKQNV